MQITYKVDELKKKYLTAVETVWTSISETDAEYKKACSELEKLVPDARLRDDIKDCFGQCLDKYQMQGFINGYGYSLQTFFKDGQVELPKDKTQMTPHQRILKCVELWAKVDIMKELCSKVHLMYNDILDEVNDENPNIKDVQLRIDIMGDYIARTMQNTDALDELVEVVYQSVGGEYVD